MANAKSANAFAKPRTLRLLYKPRTVRYFNKIKNANLLKVRVLFHKKKANSVRLSRRDRDSNPGNAFDVYTLSRRASSATRASLLS